MLCWIAEVMPCMSVTARGSHVCTDSSTTVETHLYPICDWLGGGDSWPAQASLLGLHGVIRAVLFALAWALWSALNPNCAGNAMHFYHSFAEAATPLWALAMWAGS